MVSSKKRYVSLRPLVMWAQHLRPLEWERIFGRNAGLEVEIGPGRGDFLIHRAGEHPETDFVGIEPDWVSVRHILKRIALTGTKNVRVLQADARVALERLFDMSSLDRMYALFPCPWPKKKHAKRRLFTTPLLSLINSRLVQEGELLIVTDHKGYADWVLTQVSGSGFQIASQVIPPRFNTKYEQKWRKMGVEEFHELRLVKSRHIDAPPKEDVDMQTRHLDHFDPHRFNPQGERRGIVVEFKDFLFDPQRDRAMLRAIVVEDNLTQDFWIEISRGKERWRIRPSKGCGIIPTQGVQKALDLASHG